MKMRQRVNKRIDRKIFSKTAARVKAANIPGRIISKGGTRL